MEKEMSSRTPAEIERSEVIHATLTSEAACMAYINVKADLHMALRALWAKELPRDEEDAASQLLYNQARAELTVINHVLGVPHQYMGTL